MQFVPPTHEQTPIRCSGCHQRYVIFMLAAKPSSSGDDHVPARCACGHLEDATALPAGTLFGVDGVAGKTYHPFNRPN